MLKDFVDAQWLAEFDARMEIYRTALSASPAGPPDEATDKAAPSKGGADA